MPTHTELFWARVGADQIQGNWLIGRYNDAGEFIMGAFAAQVLDDIKWRVAFDEKFRKLISKGPGKIAKVKVR